MREKIAAIQHEIWVHWMTYMFSVCYKVSDGSVLIPADKVQLWKRKFCSYSRLTEKERESDRDQANKVIGGFRKNLD